MRAETMTEQGHQRSGSALEALAGVLRYPTESLAGRARECLAALTEQGHPQSGSARKFEPFAAFASATPVEEMEELYTRTFDLNPAAALELGWHLYGERYERGEFLARLRGLLSLHGVPEDGELPDHLRLCLVLVGRLGADEAGSLVRESLLPAMRRIAGAIEDGNPYRCVLLAAEALLEERLAPAAPAGCGNGPLGGNA